MLKNRADKLKGRIISLWEERIYQDLQSLIHKEGNDGFGCTKMKDVALLQMELTY